MNDFYLRAVEEGFWRGLLLPSAYGLWVDINTINPDTRFDRGASQPDIKDIRTNLGSLLADREAYALALATSIKEGTGEGARMLRESLVSLTARWRLTPGTVEILAALYFHNEDSGMYDRAV